MDTLQDHPGSNRNEDVKSASRTTPWPHAPAHCLSKSGTYFVTVGTYRKQHFFRGSKRLEVLHRGLLTVTRDFGWQLEAWAVFSNHYHFVAHSPAAEQGAQSLAGMLGVLHGEMARWVNGLDKVEGRQVWHNFRDTLLTYERSYLARLNYVHHNSVKHGLTNVASEYPWCSAGWFERTARPAQVKTLYEIKTDTVRVFDEYDVDRGWR